MRLIVIGDSISLGTYTGPNDDCPKSIASPNYAEILKRRLGYDELINYSINGISYSSMSPVNPELSLTNRVDGFETGDLVILAAGTNDFGTNVPLGRESDKEDKSFYGAIDIVFRKIKEKMKGGTVFCLLPIKRADDESNGLGLSLADYRMALMLKSFEYGIGIINSNSFEIDPHRESDRKRYCLDGCHLNEDGHIELAEFILRYIK